MYTTRRRCKPQPSHRYALALGMPQLHRALTPVQVLQLEPGYFPGTQPAVDQAECHRIVTSALDGGAIKIAEEALNLCLGQSIGQRGRPPLSNTRHRGH